MKLWKSPFIMLVAAAALAGQAQETDPAPSTPEEPVEGFALEEKSAFTPDGIRRNPMWPIGWTPQAKVRVTKTEPVKPRIELSPENFRISSILLGNPKIALINGREYVPGQLMQTKVGETAVQIKVLEIGDGYVVLQHDNQRLRINQY